MLTLEEKKFVVQQWNITGSWIAIRRAFLKRPGYNAKNLPALSSLKLVVNKFNEFGSITDRRKGKKSAITSTEIKKVERLYRTRQTHSQGYLTQNVVYRRILALFGWHRSEETSKALGIQ